MNTDDKLKLVDPSCSQLSVSRQCRLLALSRSRFYYKPKGIDEVELEQMRILDELYLEDPIRGTRRMSKELKKLGYQCGRQQIEEAISKNGDNQIRSKFYGYMADCLGILGFHHDAIEKHNKSIALDPDDCNNYYMRSMSKGQILDHEGEIDDLKMAIRLSQKDTYSNNQRDKKAREMGYSSISQVYSMRLQMVEEANRNRNEPN